MLCQLSYVAAVEKGYPSVTDGSQIFGTLESPATAISPPLLASLTSRRTAVRREDMCSADEGHAGR